MPKQPISNEIVLRIALASRLFPELSLQQAIVTSPPPWLAKILGVAEGNLIKNYKALV